MKSTDTPKKMPVPFAINGSREDLLSQSASGDPTASYSNGFPPVTMLDESAGGIPPKGQDFNQIFYELAAIARWSNSGGAILFDSSFCTSIGGYPKYSRLSSNDGTTTYVSTVDDNLTDPNSSSSSGWTNINNLFYKVANNLSDVTDKATARSNLGAASLTGSSTQDFQVLGGAGSNSAVAYGQFTSGSNSNGAWNKGPSGAMWARLNFTLAANTTSRWTFPTSFPSPPSVLITAINGQNNCWLTGITSTYATIYNNGTSLNINALAIY